MKMKYFLLLSLLLSFSSFSEDSLPIHVKAKTLAVNYGANFAKYSGGVFTTQGDLKVNSEDMYVFYKKGAASLENISSLDRIVFEKKVRIKQGEDVASGDKAIYQQKEKKIFLTGNVILMHGKNKMKGKTVIYDTDKKFFSINNNTKKRKQRVRAVIFDE